MNRLLHNLLHILCAIVAAVTTLVAMAACSDDAAPTAPEAVVLEVKVAVVLPLSDETGARWRRVADLVQDHLARAQQGRERQVRLSIEWYDETTNSMATLGPQLADRDDIAAVIGPRSASRADTLAYACMVGHVPLFFPAITSEEVVRRYASYGFLWSLTETDVTQCELLLLKAQAADLKNIALLAPDDLYGRTFYNWFAFQATELGLNPVDVKIYTPDNRDATIADFMQTNCDVMICAPESRSDLEAVLRAYNRRYGDELLPPALFLTDAALTAGLLHIDNSDVLIEGLAACPDPTTGFSIYYAQRFDGDSPLPGEAQLYDALMLTTLAAADCRARDENPYSGDYLTAALRRLTVPESNRAASLTWTEAGMAAALDRIERADYRPLTGASGSLAFDEDNYTSILQTIYTEWFQVGGKLYTTGYRSSAGNHRVSSSVAAWNWKKTIEQSIEDKPTGIVYPARQTTWAVLVAPATGWENYRFQANVLDMYQLLRSRGFDDDHIILIAEDDLANNPRNPNPGTVYTEALGQDVYADVHIDYAPTALTPDDLADILTGQAGFRLPEVVHAGPQDNVLVFWCGHGVEGRLVWTDDSGSQGSRGLTPQRLRAALDRMAKANAYRKMLWIVEACHAGSVTEAVEGYPGVMAIASSGAQESSKATGWDKTYGTYMSNVFVRTLMRELRRNPAIDFRTLYYDLSRGTTASHIQMNNAALFDNLYLSTIEEFITP